MGEVGRDSGSEADEGGVIGRWVVGSYLTMAAQRSGLLRSWVMVMLHPSMRSPQAVSSGTKMVPDQLVDCIHTGFGFAVMAILLKVVTLREREPRATDTVRYFASATEA